jgi:DNA-binding transcriptional ArsR family regulator
MTTNKKNREQLFHIKDFERIKLSHDICFIVCSPVRFKIIGALLRHQKQGLTVTDLATMTNSSISRVSHQLHILRKHKIAEAKKSGRQQIYTITESTIKKRLPCWYLH